VLVVEDDVDIRESLVEALEDHGYEVIAVANGREALDVLRAGGPAPCLILLDLMMPTLDGRGFREQQLQDAALASIPVIVLSAYRDVAADVGPMRVAGFLRKPVRLEDLIGAATRHCPRTGPCHVGGAQPA
jgi:CheY-like chemotaxis protein